MNLQKTGTIWSLGNIEVAGYTFSGIITDRSVENDVALELSPLTADGPCVKIHKSKNDHLLNANIFRKDINDTDYVSLLTESLTLFRNFLIEQANSDDSSTNS